MFQSYAEVFIVDDSSVSRPYVQVLSQFTGSPSLDLSSLHHHSLSLHISSPHLPQNSPLSLISLDQPLSLHISPRAQLPQTSAPSLITLWTSLSLPVPAALGAAAPPSVVMQAHHLLCRCCALMTTHIMGSNKSPYINKPGCRRRRLRASRRLAPV